MKEGKKMKNEQKVQTEKCSASAKSLSIPNTVLRIKLRVIPPRISIYQNLNIKYLRK